MASLNDIVAVEYFKAPRIRHRVIIPSVDALLNAAAPGVGVRCLAHRPGCEWKIVGVRQDLSINPNAGGTSDSRVMDISPGKMHINCLEAKII
jgi:hypothetical protein